VPLRNDGFNKTSDGSSPLNIGRHMVSVIPEEDFDFSTSEEEESDSEGLFGKNMTEIKLGGQFQFFE
jgi:hypothetical protein